MNELFDNSIRTRHSIKQRAEPEYHFLNTSAWPWVIYVRSVLSGWYGSFPNDKQFLSQFTSKDDPNHLSAFFELYTYRLFQGMGYLVDYHAKIGQRLVDLHVTKENSICWCDCVLSGEPNVKSSIVQNEGVVIDEIEQIDSPDYWISIKFESPGLHTSSQRKLRRMINASLRKLRSSKTAAAEEIYEDAGWVIRIQFAKKGKSESRVIGGETSSQYSGFNDGPSMAILRKTLDRKRGSAYNIDAPYIAAVNTSNIVLTDQNIRSTLYGSHSHLKIEHPYFYDGSPQNTSVSAVLVVHGLYSSNMGCVRLELWHNPWAKYPIEQTHIMINQVVPKLNGENLISKFENLKGCPVHELLEIEQDYITW